MRVTNVWPEKWALCRFCLSVRADVAKDATRYACSAKLSDLLERRNRRRIEMRHVDLRRFAWNAKFAALPTLPQQIINPETIERTDSDTVRTQIKGLSAKASQGPGLGGLRSRVS